MAGRYKNELNWSDVTAERDFLNRRQLIAGAGAAGLGMIGGSAFAQSGGAASPFSTDAEPNTLEEIKNYCNFYEFGTGKEDPAANAPAMSTDPWVVKVDGLVDRPGDYSFDDIMKGASLEERIYRFRCVEAWSMVIPWVGFELADLLNRVGVQPAGKYVAFETAVLPDVMPGIRRGYLDWPYREGLRMDEAMNPLTIIATGLYDRPMPNQNGAPLRLVVPWKYGFKSIKSIVRISVTESQPKTSWNMAGPGEYGFYSNVNPEVDHPRWSQATERRVGGGFFAKRIETQKFNGYGDQVAALYDGMDLRKNY